MPYHRVLMTAFTLTAAVAFMVNGPLAGAQQPIKRTDNNFRNASGTEPAKALGFQYAGKGQQLQTNAP